MHDAAVELEQARMIAVDETMQIMLDGPIDREPLYLHGPCGAYLAQHELGINDPLVLETI